MINQDHLVVVPYEIIVCARHRDTRGEQLQLELPEQLGAAAGRVGDERVYLDAASDRALEGSLQFFKVEPENGDVDRFRRFFDGDDQRHEAVGGLND